MPDTSVITPCYHCGDLCKEETILSGQKAFCCNGCKSVYEILHQNELDNYYCLNSSPGISKKNIQSGKFNFLDDPCIVSKLLSYKDNNISKVSFQLPQIHCSSCLWLLENLRKINDGILSSQVNFTRKEVTTTFSNNAISLRQLAELLSQIGYEPHLSHQDIEHEQISKKDNKTAIYKLGIAGFCFANIMLISFPEYLGLSLENDPLLTNFFRLMNLALSIPVFFYCAQEFFVNALYSYRQKYLNIDTPIALAILVTFARSLYEVLTSTGGGYFDSMSGIVFFMLVGRAVQNRVFSTLQFNRDYKSYFPIAITVLKDNKETVKKISDIAANDVIVLQHNEIVPVDAFYSKGNALLDYSFITGESAPVIVNKGELVYAGGRIINGNAELLAIKPFSQNSFTQLWNNPVFSKIETDKEAGYTRLSKYFSLIVLVIAGSAFAFWYPQNTGTAWNALTAVLIIACPCALLLTASFTYGFLIEKFAENGFFVKNSLTIDKLGKINTVVFDKTGTLTEVNSLQAKPVLIHWTDEEKNVALSLMALSNHPLSKSVVAFYKTFEKINIQNFREIPGSGIEAWYGERHFKAGNSELALGEKTELSSNGSEIYITADGKLLAYFTIESSLRPGAEQLLQQITGYKTYLLSGDNTGAYRQMASIFPKDAELIFNQKPTDKLNFISHLQANGAKVLMVGDGLNDAGALKQSNVGVAVLENSFSFTPGCDGVLEAKNIFLFSKYLQTAKESKYLIYVGLAYSVIYNLIGIYYSVTGQMQPVIAAVLMPLSSLGVILLAYLGSRRIFKKF